MASRVDWQKLHVPSTECPRISAAFLESERRLLGEAIFSREYLAEFSASQTGMFDPELLQAALLPDDFSFAAPSPVPPRVYPTSQGLGAAIAAAVIP